MERTCPPAGSFAATTSQGLFSSAAGPWAKLAKLWELTTI